MASRDGSFRDVGQKPPNTGRPVKYGTPGKPTWMASMQFCSLVATLGMSLIDKCHQHTCGGPGGALR